MIASSILCKPRKGSKHEKLRFPNEDKAWITLHHRCFSAHVSKQINHHCPEDVGKCDAHIGRANPCARRMAPILDEQEMLIIIRYPHEKSLNESADGRCALTFEVAFS
ncbi:hypothetical protein KCU76_g34, partial [Aureobasidium melanogenum]